MKWYFKRESTTRIHEFQRIDESQMETQRYNKYGRRFDELILSIYGFEEKDIGAYECRLHNPDKTSFAIDRMRVYMKGMCYSNTCEKPCSLSQ